MIHWPIHKNLVQQITMRYRAVALFAKDTFIHAWKHRNVVAYIIPFYSVLHFTKPHTAQSSELLSPFHSFWEQ